MQNHTKRRLFVNMPLACVGDGIKAAALSCMWGWFVVPLGLLAIGIVHAYGLILLKSMMFPGKLDPDEEYDDEAAHKQLIVILTRTVLVLFAWVFGAGVHEMM